jgi:MFS family permease
MAKSPAIKSYLRGLSRNTFLLAFASLFADISTEMLYPVLPIFLTQTLKANGSIVGFVDGFAQAMQNIVQGISGALSDKLQRRKSIALAGYFLAAIAKPLMGLSTTWQQLFSARLLDRFGAGTRSAPRDALIAASADDETEERPSGSKALATTRAPFSGRFSPLSSFITCMSGCKAYFMWHSSLACLRFAWSCSLQSGLPL